jgi:hypothetical protein
MKIRTLPNGNMDLRDIKFVTNSEIVFTIGRPIESINIVNGITYSYYVKYVIEGEDHSIRFPYNDIVENFAKGRWKIKKVIEPIKAIKSLDFINI